MIIKSLHVSNFQSLGEIDFSFPSGLTLIDGFNSDTNSHIGSGKCITLDSLIVTDKGMVKLKDILPHESVGFKLKPDSYYDSNINIFNKNKNIEKIICTYYGGKQNTIYIKTDSGYDIEGTYNHKILCSNGEKIDFFSLEDIAKNSNQYEICIPLGYNNFINHNYISLRTNEHFRIYKKTTTVPEFLNEELAYYLGLICGDGYVTAKSIGFTSNDNQLKDWIFNFYKKYKINYIIGTKFKTNAINIKTSNRFFIQFLLDNKLVEEVLSYDKKIPPYIFQSPQSVIISFLAGLYDTDGYVDKKGSIVLALSSHELVKEVQLLLNQFNIGATFRIKKIPNYHNSYTLSIHDSDFKLKFKELGLIKLERKISRISDNLLTHQNRIYKYITLNKSYRLFLSSLMPRGKRRLMGQYTQRNAVENYPYNSRILLSNIAHIREILIEYRIEIPQYIKDIIESGFSFHRIKTVKYTQNVVADLSTPETHSFIANGIINHNTAILNSLVFGIYGQIPKNITLNDLIKDGQDKLQTRVKLEIDNKNIEINRTRTRKSTKIQLIVNGEPIDGLAKDIETRILSLIGLSFDQFVQIIYVYQNSGNRFISLNDTEKKVFLSTLFNLEMYDEAYKQAHNDLNGIEIKLSELDGSLKAKTEERERLITQKKDLEDQQNLLLLEQTKHQSVLLEQAKGIKINLDALEKQKSEFQDDIHLKALEVEKVDISHKLSQIEEFKNKINKLERNQRDDDYTIEGIDSTLKSIVGTSQCPTCHQDWPAWYYEQVDQKIADLRQQKIKIIEESKITLLEISKINVQLSSENNLRNRKDIIISEISKINATGINQILSSIDSKKQELKWIIDKYESFDKQKQIGIERIQKAESYLKEAEQSMRYKDSQIVELTDKKKYLLEIKKIFSPTGIKAYIFNGIIEQLNQSIEQHLNRLTSGEIYFKILLDEQKGKYIDTLECQGKPRSVSSLSGGEHRKLSLAVDLALSDVVCSRVNYVPNILFLDEAFNGLDVTSKEIVMEVLTEISKNKNIFVIDHSSEFKSQFTQVVKLIKQNGTTRKE